MVWHGVGFWSQLVKQKQTGETKAQLPQSICHLFISSCVSYLPLSIKQLQLFSINQSMKAT